MADTVQRGLANPATCLAFTGTIQDGEIFLPALAVGPPGGALVPAGKFKSATGMVPFFLEGCAPERVLAGADGFAGASVVAPSRVLQKLLNGMIKSIATKKEWEEGEEGEDGEEIDVVDASAYGMDEVDSIYISEARSNVEDLIQEYAQYSAATLDGGDEGDDDDEY